MEKRLENLDKKLYDFVNEFEKLKIVLKRRKRPRKKPKIDYNVINAERQRKIYVEEPRKRLDKLNMDPIVYFD